MRPRWGAALIGGLLLAAGGIYWWLGDAKTRSTKPAAASSTTLGLAGSTDGRAVTASPNPINPARATVLPRSADDFIEWPASGEGARSLNDPNQSAREDIEVVESLFADYRRVYGENPLGGLNEEITAGLRGDNPKRIRFLPEKPARLSSRGELLDRWGTPYFFHKLSGVVMEVRSAGPDHRMWTADDVGEVVESGPPR